MYVKAFLMYSLHTIVRHIVKQGAYRSLQYNRRLRQRVAKGEKLSVDTFDSICLNGRKKRTNIQ
jgi:hypothetical protein